MGKSPTDIKGKEKILGAIQIVINLLMTYEKLHCKGEPYRLQRSFGTHRQPDRHTHTDTYPVPFIQGLMLNLVSFVLCQFYLLLLSV